MDAPRTMFGDYRLNVVILRQGLAAGLILETDFHKHPSVVLAAEGRLQFAFRIPTGKNDVEGSWVWCRPPFLVVAEKLGGRNLEMVGYRHQGRQRLKRIVS